MKFAFGPAAFFGQPLFFMPAAPPPWSQATSCVGRVSIVSSSGRALRAALVFICLKGLVEEA
jgi:hypothetical protein